MSSDVVACPQCGTSLQNMPSLAGQVVSCPRCQSHLQMPPLIGPAATGLPLPPANSPSLTIPELPAPVPSLSINAEVRLPGSSGRPPSAVQERIRRRSNPIALIVAVLILLALVIVGTATFQIDRAAKERDHFTRRLVGNWELTDGQTQLDRWEFAFHEDGRLQMKLVDNGTDDLSEGRWKVIRVQAHTAYVRIDWPEDDPETMIVRVAGGNLQIELPSVGNFTFRAALR